MPWIMPRRFRRGIFDPRPANVTFFSLFTSNTYVTKQRLAVFPDCIDFKR